LVVNAHSAKNAEAVASVSMDEYAHSASKVGRVIVIAASLAAIDEPAFDIVIAFTWRAIKAAARRLQRRPLRGGGPPAK
jgi:hypothetical protein